MQEQVRWAGEGGHDLTHIPDSWKLVERLPLASTGFEWGPESKGANGVRRGMQNPKNNKGQAGILPEAISTDKELKYSSECIVQETEIEE